METVPWYQSAIVRQQITLVIVSLTGLLGINLGGLDVDATLGSIFAGITALIGVYTVVTRIFKPAPNLSQTAANKEVELVESGKIPASPTGPGSKQGGFFRTAFACVIALAALAALVVLPGCAGTSAAYKTAAGSEASVVNTAYVVTEHYAAVVKEAANLAERATTPRVVVEQMQEADAAVKPWILGDSTRPGLRELSHRYQTVKDAKTQADLQRAIDGAVQELARLINAVKAAGRS